MSVFNRNKDDKDLGFGTSGRSGRQRMINRDGRFNVHRSNFKLLYVYDIFIELIKMSWSKFIVMVIIFYSVLNLFFALLYWYIGVENLTGIDPTNKWEAFMDAFFFSAQTLTTVGYGRIAPMHIPASTVAAIESLFGLMGFALATGLLYGRFSRPVANILYSKNILVAPHKGMSALMFRISNKSNNQLIDSEMTLAIAYQTQDDNGIFTTRYLALDLELKIVQYLPLSWTLVHLLDDKSPLYSWSKSDYEKYDIEFLVSFKGTDDTFMQNVHDRTSYRYNEMIWGAKFIRMFEPNKDGGTSLHLDWIDKYENAELPNLIINE
ncbi:MAG: ion channel, partial [Pseudomonadota bacterium]